MTARRAIATIVALLLGACAAGAALAACNGSSGGGSACPTLSADCPSPPPSWQTDVHPIVATYCVPCHSEGGVAPPQFDYTTLQGVQANHVAMITQVYQCLMPPADASPPTAMPTTAERQTLLQWLVCGAPDD